MEKTVAKKSCATVPLKVDFIVEYEIIFKTALGYESLDQVGSIHEKKQSSKILWDYPCKTRFSDSKCQYTYYVCLILLQASRRSCILRLLYICPALAVQSLNVSNRKPVILLYLAPWGFFNPFITEERKLGHKRVSNIFGNIQTYNYVHRSYGKSFTLTRWSFYSKMWLMVLENAIICHRMMLLIVPGWIMILIVCGWFTNVTIFHLETDCLRMIPLIALKNGVKSR